MQTKKNFNKTEMVHGKLQEGVPLCLFLAHQTSFDEDRVNLSDGVCSAENHKNRNINYMDCAYVPSMPWRTLSSDEREILIADHCQLHYSSSIALLQMPESILELLDHLKLHKIVTQEEFYSQVNSHQGKLAIKSVKEFVQSFLVSGDEFQTILVFNEPGLTSTAFVPERNHYIGLHVDYLHQQSIHTRNLSGNRISINLGREPRYLTYVNLTMQHLIELTETKEDVCSPDSLVKNFFQLFPKYPVVRLKINPGEAYIAPTQNIIHDGIGSRVAPDLHLTICGYIGFSGILKWIEKQRQKPSFS